MVRHTYPSTKLYYGKTHLPVDKTLTSRTTVTSKTISSCSCDSSPHLFVPVSRLKYLCYFNLKYHSHFKHTQAYLHSFLIRLRDATPGRSRTAPDASFSEVGTRPSRCSAQIRMTFQNLILDHQDRVRLGLK